MSDRSITVLLSTFPGLGLPRTLLFEVRTSTPVRDTVDAIYARLPCCQARLERTLLVTTTSGKRLLHSNRGPVSTLPSNPAVPFLPIRISARLRGGKGGFGSQLRAAGGRMSSRKKRNQNEPQNGSNRNLDGRRLRTVDAAKKLADYLAKKPEMEEKEKEEQKKKWQSIVDAADATAEKIRSGKMGSGQDRLDAAYVESKELAEERTREAVIKAMRESMLESERTGSESSVEREDEGEESEDEADEGSSGSSEDVGVERKQDGGRVFFGWDDDEEDDDDEDSEEDVPPTPAEASAAYEGKGKAKAV